MILGQEGKPPLEELGHSGVRGMKWGVRKTESAGLITQPGLSKEKQAALQKYYSEGVKSGKFAKGPTVVAKKPVKATLNAEQVKANRRRIAVGALRAATILLIVGRVTFRAVTGDTVGAVNDLANAPTEIQA